LNGGQLNMENNIVVAHWAGVVVGGTAVIDHTLWGAGEWDNLYYDYSGSTITETNGIDGDPAFQNPDEYNYHITTTSAALDAGVDAGVTGDIDGEVRPLGTGFDIGADELNYDVLSLPPGSSISTSDGLLDLISDSTCTGTFTITYSSLSTPTYGTGNMMVGGMVFHLEATNSSGDPVISVSPPMTLTVGYDEGALLVDMDEVDLEILRYNVGLEDWVALTLIELDTLANTITVVLDHFSEFVVAGPGVPYRIMLPLILKD